MTTIVEHPNYGRLTHDSRTQKVTGKNKDLCAELHYLVTHRELLSGDYYPNAFLRACQDVGVIGAGIDVKITTEGEFPPPEGAVY